MGTDSMLSLPASIFEKSRISLMMVSSSLPESRMRAKVSAFAVLTLLSVPFTPASANEAAVKVMEEYLDFVDYGGATILPEQIPKDDWKRFHVIDARDKDQFGKDHIPGAVNIEWRQVLAQRSSIPKDKAVLIYCNTGSLSAQAGFALRIAGYENVRILQGG